MGPTLGHLPATDSGTAIVEPGVGSVTYGELDRLAEDVAQHLLQRGLTPGARVGLYLRRSTDAVAAMLGTLRAGCAYVPVDPRAPVDRIAGIHADGRVQLTLVEDRFQTAYRHALASTGHPAHVQSIPDVGLGQAIRAWTSATATEDARPVLQDRQPDVGCLLYTSGTTGRPKGWRMSRLAIEAHVAWCHRRLTPSRSDVFANHAPFSFGMSLFDIHASLGCGAALVLVPEEVRQHAPRIVSLLARERVTIWFSGPTVLSLIGQVQDLEAHDLSALRIVAFAGEVFPLPQLNMLRRRLPHPRYFNFYGSTETNVAAYCELPAGVTLDEPAPIGRACEHYEARVASQEGMVAPPGTPGELQFRGAGLASGYWNPDDTAERMCPASDGGDPWFRTCDLVTTRPGGDLTYVGRIGRMIKLRGYRVEPGEIEARLYEHPLISEVGVVPAESAAGLELVAHIGTADGERLSTISLKEFCAVTLPAYMVPARFEFHTNLPRTSSGKIDLRSLGAAGLST